MNGGCWGEAPLFGPASFCFRGMAELAERCTIEGVGELLGRCRLDDDSVKEIGK